MILINNRRQREWVCVSQGWWLRDGRSSADHTTLSRVRHSLSSGLLCTPPSSLHGFHERTTGGINTHNKRSLKAWWWRRSETCAQFLSSRRRRRRLLSHTHTSESEARQLRESDPSSAYVDAEWHTHTCLGKHLLLFISFSRSLVRRKKINWLQRAIQWIWMPGIKEQKRRVTCRWMAEERDWSEFECVSERLLRYSSCRSHVSHFAGEENIIIIIIKRPCLSTDSRIGQRKKGK